MADRKGHSGTSGGAGWSLEISMEGDEHWGLRADSWGALDDGLVERCAIWPEERDEVQGGEAEAEGVAGGVNRISDLFVVLRMIEAFTDHIEEEVDRLDSDLTDDEWDDLVMRLFYIAEWADGRR